MDQCVCAEHDVRSWHAGVGEDLRSAGDRGRLNLIPIYATTPSLGNDYYAEMAAFLAAESLRRMHRYGEAMAQCSSVREDFSVYVGMPLSKDSLVKACSRALRHTQAMAA